MKKNKKSVEPKMPKNFGVTLQEAYLRDCDHCHSKDKTGGGVMVSDDYSQVLSVCGTCIKLYQENVENQAHQKNNP